MLRSKTRGKKPTWEFYGNYESCVSEKSAQLRSFRTMQNERTAKEQETFLQARARAKDTKRTPQQTLEATNEVLNWLEEKEHVKIVGCKTADKAKVRNDKTMSLGEVLLECSQEAGEVTPTEINLVQYLEYHSKLPEDELWSLLRRLSMDPGLIPVDTCGPWAKLIFRSLAKHPGKSPAESSVTHPQEVPDPESLD